MGTAQKRLLNELKAWQKNPIEGIDIVDSSEVMKWKIRMRGAEGTVYQGEEYFLTVSVDQQYPLVAPTVIFEPPHVPCHEHVYSCGHICLSLLASDWSPALTIQSIMLSILSMLSSAKKKSSPPDDEAYSKRAAGRNPKKTIWAFHDTSC